MKIEGDYLVLSTGKRVYVSDGHIGLSLCANDDAEKIVYGFDGEIVAFNERNGFEYNKNALTVGECREVADHMIAAWTAYRDALE